MITIYCQKTPITQNDFVEAVGKNSLGELSFSANNAKKIFTKSTGRNVRKFSKTV